jgi:hypothetical protein
MRYSISVNRKYRYIKVYNVLKRPNESTNKISKMVSSFLEGMLTKKKE